MAKARPAIFIEGQRDLERALRHLPGELRGELADASRAIAEQAARDIRRAAGTRAEAKAARSVRARGGRVPMIAAGGGSRTEGAAMFWGTAFGGRRRPTTQQFRPWLRGQGYWFHPTIRRRGRDWAGLWLDAIDATTAKWWRNR